MASQIFKHSLMRDLFRCDPILHDTVRSSLFYSLSLLDFREAHLASKSFSVFEFQTLGTFVRYSQTSIGRLPLEPVFGRRISSTASVTTSS